MLAASSYLGGGGGKNVVVFAQDSAFGLSNYLAVNQVMGNLGGQKVGRVLVPQSAQDFTAFATQVKNLKPDLLFVAWAGTTAPAMWRALEQQGVFGTVDKVVTGLDERATWPTFGAGRVEDLVPLALRRQRAEERGQRLARHVDAQAGPGARSVHPDGFAAGQMIVRALQKGSKTDVAKMITALEGWSFTGPKGQQTIRASDHAMLQPMFQVKLQQVERQAPARRQQPASGEVHGAAGRSSTGQVPSAGQSRHTVSTILATRDLGLDIGGAHIVADVWLEVRGR